MIKKLYVIYFLTVLFFVLGTCFISYPFVSSYISDCTSTKVVMNYENQIKAKKKSELEKEKNRIGKYNDSLAKSRINPKKTDKNKKMKKPKSVYKDGEIEGYITVPKIDCMLPICEGTSEATLYHAGGHLKGTSYPFGGKSTHCVLTGHSGMSSAILFSNLDKLKIDDVFYITVLNEKHEYKVDLIKMVKPDKADKYLKIIKNKEYVSLITCAPITINTHRLIVRGHRIKYDGKLEKVKDRQLRQNFKTVLIALFVILLITFLFVIYKIYRLIFNLKNKHN